MALWEGRHEKRVLFLVRFQKPLLTTSFIPFLPRPTVFPTESWIEKKKKIPKINNHPPFGWGRICGYFWAFLWAFWLEFIHGDEGRGQRWAVCIARMHWRREKELSWDTPAQKWAGKEKEVNGEYQVQVIGPYHKPFPLFPPLQTTKLVPTRPSILCLCIFICMYKLIWTMVSKWNFHSYFLPILSSFLCLKQFLLPSPPFPFSVPRKLHYLN